MVVPQLTKTKSQLYELKSAAGSTNKTMIKAVQPTHISASKVSKQQKSVIL